MHNVIIFSGSVRKGNFTQHVAGFVDKIVGQHPEVETEIICPDDFEIDFETEGRGASPEILREKVRAADGYIIVSPEYNHGYPGSLKYLLDMNLKEYIHKPVAFVGVSSGATGGARAIEQLVGVVRELGMVATFNDVKFSNVKDEVNDMGKVENREKWERRTNRLLEEFLWMSETLKHGRENIEVAGE